jgi:V/A-type H+/Na+-transporting ATPase subunit K
MGIIAGILTLVAGVIYFFILFRAIASRKKESVKRAVILGTLVLVLSFVVLGLFSTNVFAQASSAEQQIQKDDPIALGLKYVGAALAVGLAAIGAGIAVGPIGVSAISVIAEKPEMLGTSLIFIGLAEGIAIYGIAIAILIMFVI